MDVTAQGAPLTLSSYILIMQNSRAMDKKSPAQGGRFEQIILRLEA